jgi:ATP-binding cassette subfamily B protein/ATP-binding cassette subfamily C protein
VSEERKKAFGFRATMRTLKLSLQIMVKYQPSYLFLLLAAGLAEAAKPFVAVLLPKLVLEELSGARDPARLLLLTIAAAGFSGLIYWLSGYLSLRRDRANAKFNNLTDRVLADRTLTMDYPYLEDPEVLKMVQQFMQGRMTQGGLAGAGWALGNGLPALLTALGMLFILARLSGGLLGLLLAATAVSLVLLRLQVKYLSGMTMEMADGNRILGYLFSIFTDFSYGKDIRLFEAEPLMTTRMKDTVDELWRVCFGNYTKSGACQAGRAAIAQGVVALIYAMLAVQTVQKGLSIADFVMLTAAAVSFASSVMTAVTSAMNFYGALKMVAPFGEYMNLPPVLSQGSEPVPELTGEDAVVFDHVSFTYPRAAEPTLKDLCFTIKRGERLAVVGENGAGKTTMIKLLLRLYEPDEGTIYLGGRDIRTMSREETLKQFAVVFQDFKLLAFSVKENICIGPDGDEERLHEVLRKLDLDKVMESTPHGAETSVYRLFDEEGVEFSGGERQKMAIARALYKDSPIVVMDEPTAALDPIAEAEIYGHLNQLVEHKTALFISHRLSSCKFCDRVAVFENGGVTQCGSHKELMAQEGLYRRMFAAQARYYV